MHPSHRAFLRWLRDRRSVQVGQLWIRVGKRYEVRHERDRGQPASELKSYRDPRAARDIALCTDDGKYRPLRSAPNLRGGWRMIGLDFDGLVTALNEFHPAALAHWHLKQESKLPVTHYRDCAARQTGMYRITTKLSEEQVRRVAAGGCAAGECLKFPEWQVDATTKLDLGKPPVRERSHMTIPCPEPCSVLMSFARRVVRLEQEESMDVKFTKSDLQLIGSVLRSVLDGTQGKFREGDHNDPRHRQRIRYFLQKYRDILPRDEPSPESVEE